MFASLSHTHYWYEVGMLSSTISRLPYHLPTNIFSPDVMTMSGITCDLVQKPCERNLSYFINNALWLVNDVVEQQ